MTTNPINKKNILIVSGEKSGDIHGAELISSMKKASSEYHFDAVGGDFLKNAGAEIIIDSKEMGVIGLVEIFGKIGFFWDIYQRLKSAINSGKYDAVILIDYPTLNIKLAGIAKKAGLKVFYYISPQLWAWREGRVKKIEENVDVMFVILPFEEEFYAKHGVEAHYIGHPFLETVKTKLTKEEFFEKNGFNAGKKLICLMPGSRGNEILKLGDLILESAQNLTKKHGNLQFVMPCAATINEESLENLIKQYEVRVKVVHEQNHEAMAYSEFMIMASGSSTLEAGLLGTPMIIIYKLSGFTYFLAKYLVKVPFIGLVNIVLNKGVVPELIQHDANPENIVKEADKYLTDKQHYQNTREELKRVKEILEKEGATDSAAQIIKEKLNDQEGDK